MAQGLAQQQQQQQQQQQPIKLEISPSCLIPSYHTLGSTVVLPAAEPKGPLTLVRRVHVKAAALRSGPGAVQQYASYEKQRHPDGLAFFLAKG